MNWEVREKYNSILRACHVLWFLRGSLSWLTSMVGNWVKATSTHFWKISEGATGKRRKFWWIKPIALIDIVLITVNSALLFSYVGIIEHIKYCHWSPSQPVKVKVMRTKCCSFLKILLWMWLSLRLPGREDLLQNQFFNHLFGSVMSSSPHSTTETKLGHWLKDKKRLLVLLTSFEKECLLG